MNKPRLWLSTLAFGLLAGGGAMADPLTLDDISAWLNATPSTSSPTAGTLVAFRTMGTSYARRQ